MGNANTPFAITKSEHVIGVGTGNKICRRPADEEVGCIHPHHRLGEGDLNLAEVIDGRTGGGIEGGDGRMVGVLDEHGDRGDEASGSAGGVGNDEAIVGGI